jgi:micrococcal nuclease
MRKLIFLLILFFVSGCTGSVVYDESVKLDGPFLAVNIVDGDTLDLNNSKRVRLSGINTPERGECYYQEAKRKLEELTLNKEVFLERDISDKDKYGRWLRYVYVDDLFVNSILVEQGYARVYDKYSYDTKRYNELKRVELIAKNNGLGVWVCKDPKEDCLYVASKNSEVYHKIDCKWAKRITEKNLICFKSLEEVIEAGLRPCSTCRP